MVYITFDLRLPDGKEKEGGLLKRKEFLPSFLYRFYSLIIQFSKRMELIFSGIVCLLPKIVNFNAKLKSGKWNTYNKVKKA